MRRNFHARFFVFVLFFVAGVVGADEWVQGQVVNVHDGDTATVATRDGKTLRVRFYGVDAPERATEYWPDQAFGKEAGDFMTDLLLNHAVKVRLTGEHTYQREVGEIFIADRSASRELLRVGLGWWNRPFARKDATLRRLEQRARKAHIGLWRDKRPLAPWRYRKQYHSREN